MDGTPTIDPPAALTARLLSFSPSLLGVAGSDGVLTLVNPAWTTVLGWPEDQLLGRPLLELVHADDRAGAEVLLTGAGESTCRMLCLDGAEHWIRWSAHDGCLAGEDLAEQARLAAELQDFVYVASHDLAEPVRMITAYMDLLERRYGEQLDETAQEFIGYAVDGAERMKAMIDALLAFSRVGSHAIAPAEFDLRELLAGADGVELREPLPRVRADPAQIAQLLHQLLDNARKFRASDREPLVIVAAQEEDGGVRIDVSDNGIGIAEPQQERVFKMFTRLHGRDEYEGTGIGLALCRRIAERHGGRITLVSEPGSGSVFSVWLPR
ncbi:MAG: ATP-binding protein [Solirubrobacteraceae bacterium]